MKTKSFLSTFFANIPARALAVVVLSAIFFTGCSKSAGDAAGAKIGMSVLRVGYFPNITHAQGVIGRMLTAEGKGWFEERLGPGVKVEWYAYNAGPSAMEAMITGAIDLTYVGPNPALNGYMISNGDDIRVVAGSANGGATLLVRPAAGINTPADFKGKKVATPQFGNTQDIAARVWLRAQGFKVTQSGGDVQVIPTQNPDQLQLFQQGLIDAVWTVEPWVSRIEEEAGGKVFLEQEDAITTILVASASAIKGKRELVQKFLKGHRELTAWINAHPDEAQALVQHGITDTVKREIPLKLVQDAWKRLHFTADIQRKPLEELVAQARELGFIKSAIKLDRFLDTNLGPAPDGTNSKSQ